MLPWDNLCLITDITFICVRIIMLFKLSTKKTRHFYVTDMYSFEQAVFYIASSFLFPSCLFKALVVSETPFHFHLAWNT